MSWSLQHGMVVRRLGGATGVALVDLIWIHGLGEHSRSFDAIAHHPALAGHAHLLVDLPGYGRAPWPQELPAGDSLAHAAQVLAAWIDERPADDQNLPVLIGHSQGGVLATLVAERTTVRGVINVDGNLTIGDCTFSAQAAQYTTDDFATRGFAEMRDRIYEGGVTEPALRGYHAAMSMASPAVFHRNALDLVAASERGDLAGRFASLRCPKVFIAGDPRGICAASREALRRAGVHTVAIGPSGHWPFVDQPDAFAAAVADFLAKLA
jgi:pimeloyl-ACP methyl ester carboxylesterase